MDTFTEFMKSSSLRDKLLFSQGCLYRIVNVFRDKIVDEEYKLYEEVWKLPFNTRWLGQEVKELKKEIESYLDGSHKPYLNLSLKLIDNYIGFTDLAKSAYFIERGSNPNWKRDQRSWLRKYRGYKCGFVIVR